MEYRQLGNSGLRVSVLSLGTMTFGGDSSFSKVGATDLDGARRQVDLCIEAGVNLFDTANIYSHGASEEILGKALEGRRNDVLVATKARMLMRDGPNEGGASRYHIIRECEDSLRRLKTDYIDLYQLHDVELTAQERARLDAVSQPVLLYPYWHQAKTAKERLSEADLALLAPYI